MPRKTTRPDERPIFYFNGDQGKEVKAGGILFYRNNKLLMIYSRNQIEDFGGKSDIDDKNIYDTVSREVEEESNKIFKAEKIKNLIKGEPYVYIPWSKYALFFVELTTDYDLSEFGHYENYDKIKRDVIWVPMDEFFDRKKNFRLNCKDVAIKIRELNESYKCKPIMANKTEIKFKNLNCKIHIIKKKKVGLFIPDEYKHVPFHISKCIWKRVYGMTVEWNNELVCLGHKNDPQIWVQKKIYIPQKIRALTENRGTIYEKYVNEEYKIISLSFFKFWNYDHSLALTKKIIWDNETIIYEKIDGYFVKLFHYNGKWYLSTNNMVDVKNIFVKNYDKTYFELFVICLKYVLGKKAHKFLKFDSLNKNYTYMFELVHPDIRNITFYKNPAIFHIGTRNMITLKEIDCNIGIPKPKQYHISRFPTIQSVVETANNIHWSNSEGFVVCDRNYVRISIKSPSYINEHRLLKKNKITEYIKYIWSNGENELDKFLEYHPELHKQYNKIDNKMKMLYNELIELDNKMQKYYTNRNIFHMNLNKMKTNNVCKKILIDSYYNNYDISWKKFLEIIKEMKISTFIDAIAK